ncbi:LexA family protein [Acinetobacter tibetensis]|jgi:DNA polymerase V|uniref:Translesion error-prone DNA polymerase V autoproteolytic subunit n=1 Tax=Acinetobacter tibetensis TaxID=2943497 RepID=A0AAE9S1T6_9GAMM|nr:MULTISPECIES: translesion error-prone DNA polymerase V autoproteolytic subunit [Acinetobacter]PWB13255.1 DNA polymerase V [Acinetobacter sp. AM]USE84664.1 translesion error-prone DNA polymerase V autoproteolytic subunit [Acinetobacter tibetensis]
MSESNTTSHGGKRANAGRKSHYTEKTVVMRVPESKVMAIKEWLKPVPKDDRQNTIQLNPIHLQTELSIPSPLESVAAGFPSPAQDYIEDYIDLNKYLVKNPASTFILRVDSLSMKNAGIDAGDQILIDRKLNAEHGDIVLALINNEFTVKRFMQDKHTEHGFRFWLKAENPDYPDIYPHGEENIAIWGVVICILKKLK